jgi:hypothetical protein
MSGEYQVAVRDREMERHIRELEETKREYEELLYAVARKFPGETRHQTALRYIQEAEQVKDWVPGENPEG